MPRKTTRTQSRSNNQKKPTIINKQPRTPPPVNTNVPPQSPTPTVGDSIKHGFGLGMGMTAANAVFNGVLGSVTSNNDQNTSNSNNPNGNPNSNPILENTQQMNTNTHYDNKYICQDLENKLRDCNSNFNNTCSYFTDLMNHYNCTNTNRY